MLVLRIAVACLILSVSSLKAQDMTIPLPASLLESHGKLQPAAVVCFLEGPAVDAAGSVYFSDINGNRILKMDEQGTVTTFRADSGRTNGNTFDSMGRLISCEGA